MVKVSTCKGAKTIPKVIVSERFKKSSEHKYICLYDEGLQTGVCRTKFRTNNCVAFNKHLRFTHKLDPEVRQRRVTNNHKLGLKRRAKVNLISKVNVADQTGTLMPRQQKFTGSGDEDNPVLNMLLPYFQNQSNNFNNQSSECTYNATVFVVFNPSAGVDVAVGPDEIFAQEKDNPDFHFGFYFATSKKRLTCIYLQNTCEQLSDASRLLQQMRNGGVCYRKDFKFYGTDRQDVLDKAIKWQYFWKNVGMMAKLFKPDPEHCQMDVLNQNLSRKSGFTGTLDWHEFVLAARLASEMDRPFFPLPTILLPKTQNPSWTIFEVKFSSHVVQKLDKIQCEEKSQ